MNDELYDAASRLVVTQQKASVAMLQRQLHIGYSRASSLLAEMEQDGLVTKPYSDGQRMLLVKADYFVAVDAELAKAES